MVSFALTSQDRLQTGDSEAGLSTGEFVALKRRIHARFVADVDPAQASRLSRDELAAPIAALTQTLLSEAGIALPGHRRQALVEAVTSEIAGLGPLEPLLGDETITEILVNGPGQVYIERDGRLTRSTAMFDDNAHLLRIIERIVAPLGRRIDEASPMVDGRLNDGSRVNAIIPPLAVKGPALSIRKFARAPLMMADLVRLETLTAQAAAFLCACVTGRRNIIVSGGTGSGKT
ncbi:MAG: Flp pilus assembly complex ATPase component TadA, partial [Armatimonadota bacterium]|nr:Flp pilus assembly complex ATPase component TadA [Armatimonadota bacterium]